MILFIFEGKKPETPIFKTMERLFLPQETETSMCIYNSNIYSLYGQLKSHDTFEDFDTSGNTVSILKDILKQKGDNSLENVLESDVSEIYLFFDYDFQQSRKSLEENNRSVQCLLDYFDDETENGKLYINYPMSESLFYTRQLPDSEYVHYTVTRAECKNFKDKTKTFCYYKDRNYLILPCDTNISFSKLQDLENSIRQNWKFIIEMNVKKANYLCHGNYGYPQQKPDISQDKIYLSQLKKYVDTDSIAVSILNSFPLFLYEYLKAY